MPAVVSDSSVLISLGVAGQFHLLKELYIEVLVPNAVWHEVVVISTSAPGSKETAEAKQAGWLKVQAPSNLALVASLQTTLGAGEAEAIVLAAEIQGSLLLMDENDGRKQAKLLGLAVTGTIGVLLLAKNLGKISAIKPILKTLMQQNNFRLAQNLYQQVLQQAGEVP